jgi:hypothetical protein
MVSPDNTKVNFIPSDEGDSTSEQPQVAPVKSTIKSTKDFKKVLGKEKGDGKEDKGAGAISKRKTPVKMFTEESDDEESIAVMAKNSKDDEEDASQMAAISLFDLSKQAHKEKTAEVNPKAPVKEVTAVESPNELFKRMSSKSVSKEFKGAPEKAADNHPVDKPKTENFTARYAQEQPDLSYVNPLAGIQQNQVNISMTPTPKVEGPRSIDPAMQSLIEQIVKQMYTVDTQGKTDTVMVLQYPPLFKDAKIIVSAYDTAKGQFNVSFENLTQAAQKVLDLDQNRKSLQLALEHKGYNIQVMTTTTIQLQNIAGTEQPSREGQEEQKKERDQSQQQKKQRG